MNWPPRESAADVTLAILAGGEGRRMGQAKGHLSLDGQPILERLLARLDWPGPTLLITAPGREHPPGHARFAAECVDARADQGPLRGIATALAAATTPTIVVIPVDMPEVTDGPLRWLVARLRQDSRCAGVMMERPDGGPGALEPLPLALEVAAAAPLVAARLAGDRLSLRALAHEERFVVVPSPLDCPASFWTNLNRREELDAYDANNMERRPR